MYKGYHFRLRSIRDENNSWNMQYITSLTPIFVLLFNASKIITFYG